jgi:translation elongation factor EF-Tu-like GTPase
VWRVSEGCVTLPCMSASKPYLRIAAVGQPDHGPMALVVAMAVRFGYAGRLEAAAGWETPLRHVRLFDGRHRVCDDAGRRCPTDALVVVVAADEGPQAGTREQVRAARQVGIEHVVVFLNRAPALADEPARLDAVEADTRRLLAEFGYPADDVPVIRGDAVASAGACLEELRSAVDRVPPARNLPDNVPENPTAFVGVLGARGSGKTSLLAAVVTRLARVSRPLVGGVPRVRPGEVGSNILCGTPESPWWLSELPGVAAELLDVLDLWALEGMNAAVLVVGADSGPLPPSRDLAHIVRHVGVPNLVVFLNRCDLVNRAAELDDVEGRLRTMPAECGWPGDEVPVIRGSALRAEVEAGSDERATACIDDLLDLLAGKVHAARPLPAPGATCTEFEAAVYLCGGRNRLPLFSGLPVELHFRGKTARGRCVMPPGVEAGPPGRCVAVTVSLSPEEPLPLDVGHRFALAAHGGRPSGRPVGGGIVTRVLG